jgi:hypothetical protein
MSLMWVDRYFKNTLQLYFRNCVKLSHVVVKTVNISVNTKYCNSAAELISEFPLPTPSGTCTINNACRMLQAFTQCFEGLTKTLRGLNHLF